MKRNVIFSSLVLILNLACGSTIHSIDPCTRFDTSTKILISLSANDMPNLEVSPELEDIVTQFRSDLEKYEVFYEKDRLRKLKVISFVDSFGPTEKKNTVAFCRKVEKESSAYVGKRYSWYEIIVNRKFYEKSDESDKNYQKIILYHELAHCILGLGHLPENEVGIMSSNIAKIKDPENFDKYVEKMFQTKEASLSFLDDSL